MSRWPFYNGNLLTCYFPALVVFYNSEFYSFFYSSSRLFDFIGQFTFRRRDIIQ